MGEVRFYHLVHQPLEAAAPLLMEKILQAGARALVKTPSQAQVSALDEALWTYSTNSFLPHGTAKTGYPEHQPIFLTTDDANPNSATMLVLIDNASPPPDWQDYERVLYMFDGRDDAVVNGARNAWTWFKDKAETLSYWQQNDQGRWEKKA